MSSRELQAGHRRIAASLHDFQQSALKRGDTLLAMGAEVASDRLTEHLTEDQQTEFLAVFYHGPSAAGAVVVEGGQS